jgi:hypothetical protein
MVRAATRQGSPPGYLRDGGPLQLGEPIPFRLLAQGDLLWRDAGRSGAWSKARCLVHLVAHPCTHKMRGINGAHDRFSAVDCNGSSQSWVAKHTRCAPCVRSCSKLPKRGRLRGRLKGSHPFVATARGQCLQSSQHPAPSRSVPPLLKVQLDVCLTLACLGKTSSNFWKRGKKHTRLQSDRPAPDGRVSRMPGSCSRRWSSRRSPLSRR